MFETWLVLIHAGATLFMTGLIWFVQVVHYAMFDRVGAEGFARYEADHQRLTTRVVAPVMLIEMVTAVALVVAPPAAMPAWVAWLGLAMVAVLWVSTAALQVPMHRKLSLGFDPMAHRRLVFTNWLRTALWTARGGLALWMIPATLAAPA